MSATTSPLSTLCLLGITQPTVIDVAWGELDETIDLSSCTENSNTCSEEINTVSPQVMVLDDDYFEPMDYYDDPVDDDITTEDPEPMFAKIGQRMYEF